ESAASVSSLAVPEYAASFSSLAVPEYAASAASLGPVPEYAASAASLGPVAENIQTPEGTDTRTISIDNNIPSSTPRNAVDAYAPNLSLVSPSSRVTLIFSTNTIRANIAERPSIGGDSIVFALRCGRAQAARKPSTHPLR
ncbi:hypothetical protein THAOC_26271, partial [Thalassiosira oceanica]